MYVCVCVCECVHQIRVALLQNLGDVPYTSVVNANVCVSVCLCVCVQLHLHVFVCVVYLSVFVCTRVSWTCSPKLLAMTRPTSATTSCQVGFPRCCHCGVG